MLLNNVGDPDSVDASHMNAKSFERAVMRFVTRLAGAAPEEVFGFVAESGTDANRWAIYQARRRLPLASLFHSAEAHSSIPALAEEMRIPAYEIPVRGDGGMDPEALRRATRGKAAAIVVATVGTTFTGAVDDVPALRRAADPRGGVHLHVDAALGGLVCRFAPERPPWGFEAGADSVMISGEKLPGCDVSGLAMVRREYLSATRIGAYTGAVNHTLSCSRSGAKAVELWLAFRSMGVSGMRVMVRECLEVAEYAATRLEGIGLCPWRDPASLTVTFDAPSTAVINIWSLPPAQRGRTHLITMPHFTRDRIDALIRDLLVDRGHKVGLAPAGTGLHSRAA